MPGRAVALGEDTLWFIVSPGTYKMKKQEDHPHVPLSHTSWVTHGA